MLSSPGPWYGQVVMADTLARLQEIQIKIVRGKYKVNLNITPLKFHLKLKKILYTAIFPIKKPI